MKKKSLLSILKRRMKKDKDVLFAYLYGSSAFDSAYPGSDIDIAVFLRPSSIREYIRKEAELSAVLIAELRNDNVDLRILNTLPFLLQYKVLKDGMPILINDEAARAEFDIATMNRFFELKPYLDEYKQMLLLKIQSSI
ncbi:MAG: type VII toxin-antitoxin system MntA family adenylyltransferase antitoxin [Candidatus Aminicenantales bacterium]